MPKQARIFRVFISSTFEDWKLERDFLQRGAFRNLRQYCLEKGWHFQAVDLRWGITNEATIDQRTMEICLKEIQRCQEQSPRPNFIALLGGRYGWRPLPGTILEQVAVGMERQMPAEVLTLFRQWYDLDENQLPEPVYKLRSREGRYIDYESYNRTVQAPLGAFFTRWSSENLPDPDLADHAVDPLALQRLSMERSATEQEIHAGAFRIPDAEEHVLGFFRNIPACPPSNHTYHDEDQLPVDRLRRHLRDHLPDSNIFEFDASWDPVRQMPGQDHLSRLSLEVESRLKGIIDRAIAKYEQADEARTEEDAHERFAEERTFGFSGRVKDIETIRDYALSSSAVPLVLWGGSGTGKSTLLARAARELRTAIPDARIIARFIGVTGRSSNGHTLLTDVSRNLCSLYGGDPAQIPEEPFQLQAVFPQYLAKATAQHPLFLFLDALDQLSEADPARHLTWLPSRLPDHVKVVLSTLREDCFERLRERREPAPAFHEITPMTSDDGRRTLNAWLQRANRNLQEHQIEQIIKDFEHAGCAPLYLHLAFEQARHWESFRKRQRLGRDIPEIIEEFYDSLSRPEAHGSIVEIVLPAIRCARQGLSDDEILGLLAADNDFWNKFGIQAFHAWEAGSSQDRTMRQVPPVLWIRLYHDLEYYLTRRNVPGGEVIAFYHRQLAEAVDNVYLARSGARQQHHHALAEYFAGETWLLRTEAPLVANARKCDELPWQLIKARDWDAVTEALANLEFIQAKAVAGMVYEMVQDFNSALEAIPEHEDQVREDRERLARLSRYSQDLVAFARREIPELAVPESTQPQSPEVMEAAIERMKANPARVDVLRAFLNFLGVEALNLRKYSREMPDFVIQQAWNHAQDGPLKTAAERAGPAIRARLLRSRPACRPPWNPLPPISKRLKGHSHFVFSAKITADGRRALSSAGDNTLLLWDIESGRILRSLSGHSVPVWALALTPDGRRALSGSSDNTCILWDLESGLPLRHLEGHAGPVRSVSLSPDGRIGLSASDDGSCVVWDVDHERPLRTLAGHQGGVHAVSMTPDCRVALSGSANRLCILWDVDTGTPRRILAGHTQAVRTVDLTPDGRRAVSGSDDTSCIVWDLENGSILHTLRGHTDAVRSVSMTPDGRYAMSGASDNTCILWDLALGEPLKILTGHTGEVLSVSLTPDGERALSGSVDTTCILWDIKDGMEQRTLPGHTGMVPMVALVPESNLALSGSSDSSCILWDVESGRPLKRLLGHTARIRSLSITPDGRRALSGSDDKSCILWDLGSGEAIRTLSGHSRQVQDVIITPDGGRALSSSGDKTCILWDLENGEPLQRLAKHKGWIQTMDLTPDGRSALTGSWDGTLILWDLETCQARLELVGHSGWVWMSGLTPDGECAVSASVDHTCILWSLRSGRMMKRLAGHDNSVRALALSPDGRHAVSGSWDHTLILWDLRTGAMTRAFRGHLGPVWWVTFSPDGRRVLSASEDNTCVLWDIETGRMLALFPRDCPVSFAGIFAGGIMVGDESGEVAILETSRENFCPGPGIATARRIWDFSEHSYRDLSADCPFCGHRFAPPATVLATLEETARVVRTDSELSPCLVLPDHAWEQTDLLTDCPFCRARLRFNPFLAT